MLVSGWQNWNSWATWNETFEATKRKWYQTWRQPSPLPDRSMVKLTDIIPGPHQVVPERDAIFNVQQYEEKNYFNNVKNIDSQPFGQLRYFTSMWTFRVAVCSDCFISLLLSKTYH